MSACTWIVATFAFACACGCTRASTTDDASAIDARAEQASDAGVVDADIVDADVAPADASAPPTVVDTSTLTGKLMMGYQGWFAAAGDGSLVDSWRHWSGGVVPSPSTVTFEMWPDLREYDPSELFATAFEYAGGEAAGLYSAYTPATVARHFRWMKEYGIDGAFLQHFLVELAPGSPSREFRDRVMQNVRAGAEAHGRAFAIMYDVSGAAEGSAVATIQAHWQAMVDAGVVGSARYLRHRDRPLVAVWGFGFTDRPGAPSDVQALIDWWHTEAPPAYRATVMGGVPTGWRTLDGDSKSDPAWANVYRSFDVVSPWTVGRYGTDADIRSFRATRIEPDLAAATAAGADYMPVVWPGFSWANLFPGQPLNQIPRRGGRHWWTQLYEFTDAGATMVYGAMFDEVDEATAMFKTVERAADLPTTGTFLTLDADGEDVPSDFYLRLAGEGARVLRGELEATPARPISP